MNPFRETIVASAWDDPRAHVPDIHGEVFEQCLRGIAHVRQARRSAGLVIHGEAGSGKTHLLSRLRGRLTPREPSATTREECLYVWVRLQTSPRMIWRALRRTMVDDWFRPVAAGHTQFERILFHRLAEVRPAEGDLERWYEYMLDQQPEGLIEALEEIATRIDLDRNTDVAFRHIAFGRHRRDLRAWLAGDSLPEAALARLDLEQTEGTDDDREDESRRIVLMLCRLAGNGLPIVLSFDQVEALQMAPGDREALFAFGQLVSTLHDGTTNVLSISCVQSTFYGELKDRARGADYDRMTSLGALSLDPLRHVQAEKLIASRRTAATGSLPPAASRDSCWPLTRRELDDLLGGAGVSPRRLLNACAEKYDTRARGPVDPPPPSPAPVAPGSVAGFLEDRWTTSVEQRLAANTPDRTEEIVRHGLPLLVSVIAPEARQVRDLELPDVSLVFETPAGRSGLSVCAQPNMTSRAARLRRLTTQFTGERLARLVIVEDVRVPLTKGADKARQYLAQLEEQGAEIVFPAVEALAALDALRELLSDAKSGDLSCRGEPVAPQSVAEWLAAHLPESLRELSAQALWGAAGGAPTDDDAMAIEALSALLTDRHLMPLTEAAQALGRSSDDLVAAVGRHPSHFRLIGEPPQIVFRAVETTYSAN
ncbi:MAG: hypothetical protein ACT4QC_03745 [Planctomycetaceae bacterium]